MASWWAALLGGAPDPDGTDDVVGLAPPGAPFEWLVFVRVPEPKTVKNRIHWDVVGPDVTAVLDAGATLLRSPDEDVSWHVLADPEGNEFCFFTD